MIPPRQALAALLLLIWVCPLPAADALNGKRLFHEHCTLCHSAEIGDHGSAQGPDLTHLLGRHVAGDPAFPYTRALRDAGFAWDGPALATFLAAPAALIPGNAMGYSVPRKADRDDLVAYFQALSAGISLPAVPAPSLAPVPPRAPSPAAGRLLASDANGPRAALHPVPDDGLATDADWREDAPGRVHRVLPQVLPPAPAASLPAVANPPTVIARPPGVEPRLPPGFTLNVFASDLDEPRKLLVAPNGDVFVAQTRAGRITVLHPSRDGTTADAAQTFAQGLMLPFGLAFYPADSSHPDWLYVAETNRVVRYPYQVGDSRARGLPQVVVPQLTPVTGGHWTRDIAFSADGRLLLVSVGSLTDAALGMPRKSPAEIQAWEAGRSLGATWGPETNRADVLAYRVDGREPGGRVYATGLANCVSLTVQPDTGLLWCTTSERDLLGDDLVPDYSTRVTQGEFFGWPWYYLGSHEDPRWKGARPDLAGKVSVPDVAYAAHSAALDLVFYTATSGRAAFPRDYVGDAFAVLHGSWDRSRRTGYKVVRVRMKDGVPTGEYEDFLVGFIVDDRHVFGRPVAAAVQDDGSLLVSDDAANLIYRIAYQR